VPVVFDIHILARDCLEEDMDMVVDGWATSYADSHAAGVIPPDLHHKVYRPIISRAIKRSKARVLYNVQHPGQNFGFLCAEFGEDYPIVHYIYLKHFLRRQGLARYLLEDMGVNPKKPFVYGWKSRIAGDLVRGHWVGGRFDPILVKKMLAPPREKQP
jgi:hypothetical protein